MEESVHVRPLPALPKKEHVNIRANDSPSALQKRSPANNPQPTSPISSNTNTAGNSHSAPSSPSTNTVTNIQSPPSSPISISIHSAPSSPNINTVTNIQSPPSSPSTNSPGNQSPSLVTTPRSNQDQSPTNETVLVLPIEEGSSRSFISLRSRPQTTNVSRNSPISQRPKQSIPRNLVDEMNQSPSRSGSPSRIKPTPPPSNTRPINLMSPEQPAEEKKAPEVQVPQATEAAKGSFIQESSPNKESIPPTVSKEDSPHGGHKRQTTLERFRTDSLVSKNLVKKILPSKETAEEDLKLPKERIPNVIQEGSLLIHKHYRGWKKKYFLLDDENLYQFKHDQDTNIPKCIILNGAAIEIVDKKKNVIRIINEEFEYKIMANTEVEAAFWLESLRRVSSGEVHKDKPNRPKKAGANISRYPTLKVTKRKSSPSYERMQVVKELVDTESEYLNSLEVLLDFYKRPLEESKLVPENYLKIIFGNIEEVYAVSKKLVQEFQQRIQGKQFGEEESPPVGEILLKIIGPSHGVYVSYLSNNQKALEIEKQCMKIPTFHSFVLEVAHKPEAHNLPLSSYLIKPVQRITKYPLLLRELRKTVSVNDPEHSKLGKMIEAFEDLVSYINTKIYETKKFEELKSKVDPSIKLDFLESPGQSFIREGQLEIVINGKKQEETHCILLKTVFLITKIKESLFDKTKEKLDFKEIIPLNSVAIREPDKTIGLPYCFVVEAKEGSKKKKFVFNAESYLDKMMWMAEFEKQIEILTSSLPDIK